MSLASRVHATLRRAPDRRAFAFDDVWYDWNFVRGVADAVGLAVGGAASVGWLARNRPAMLAGFAGLLAANRSVSVLNPHQARERLLADLGSMGSRALVADADDVVLLGLDAWAREVGGRLVIVGPDGSVACLDPHPGAAALAAPGEQRIVLLTSGTTGPSKRIPLPAGAIEAAGDDWNLMEEEAAPLGTDAPRFVMFSPMTNIGGIAFAIPTLLSGRPLVLLEKFTVAAWVEAVEHHRVRLLYLPPTAIRMVLKAGIDPARLASGVVLRFGSAPLDLASWHEFEETFGIPLLPQYGATEFAGITVAMTLAERTRVGGSKVGSVGRPRPGIGVRVVDPVTGTELPAGEDGRLELSVPRIGQDWVSTNDLARLDEDGFVFLQGRADDAINRGGFKVLANDVANVLRQHPAVGDAAVVGQPDERLGEIPVAAVELRDGSPRPDSSDLVAFARHRLLPYQVPVHIEIVEALPRTTTMKINVSALKAMLSRDT